MAIKKEGIQPKPSFLKSPAIPLVLIAACFTIALLAQSGYINLPHFGKQSEYILDNSVEEESANTETIKITDGTVDSPYYDRTIVDIKGCTPPCKFSIDAFLPAGLELNQDDGSISGTPTVAGTWTFGMCFEDAEYEGCLDNEFSITIKPKQEPSPIRGDCPTKPNPPCHSVQDGGEIPVQAEGMLVYDYCRCPDGTHDSGTRDTISTPGTIYKICICD